jgi:hypothetical protein
MINRALQETKGGDHTVAWKLLEEAHIFSQIIPYQHAHVHWQMLSLAFKERSYQEMWGQCLRFLLVVPASLTRQYPPGNSGRSNVSMFAPMPIPMALKTKFRRFEMLEERRIKAGGILPKYQRKFPLTRER